MKLHHHSIVISVLLFLTACSSTPTDKDTKNNKNLVGSDEVKLNLKFPLDNPTTAKDSVLKALESVVSINNTDAMSWNLLAKAYYDKQYYTRAIRAANEAIAINPAQTESKKIALLAAVKLSEIKLNTLKKSKGFNQDMQEEVQIELTKLAQSLN